MPSPTWPCTTYLDSWTWHSGSSKVFSYSIGLSPPGTSTPGVISSFGPTTSSFWSFSLLFPSSILDTFLGFIFQCHIFCLLILFMGFSRGKNTGSGLPLPSPVDYLLLELSTMIHLSWVTQTCVSCIAGHCFLSHQGTPSNCTFLDIYCSSMALCSKGTWWL